MAFLIGGANTLDDAYEISNSVRFEGAAATGLARFGNNSRDGNTFTISAWIKRVKLGRTELFNSKVEDSGVNSLVIMFDSNDKLSVIGQPASGSGAGGNRTAALTSAVYRDVGAWYHVVYRQDTTDGTAGNRHRIYVNGVEQTLGTNDALDQNVAFNYFYNASSYPFAIANDERDNSYGSFYIAEHHYTDGVSNGPDAFGKTNANGVWVPKEYTGSHGSYGHYLKFENSGAGSGTTAIGGHDYTTGSSSTIGADSSGNDNHFHVQGYSAEDHTTDTPTNNFCTLNPLGGADSSNHWVFSEGNTQIAQNNNNNWRATGSTMAVSKGKWYWEIEFDAGTMTEIFVGVHDSEVSLEGTNRWANGSTLFYNHNGGEIRQDGENTSNDYGTLTAGDILGVALNMDDNQITFYDNGSAIASNFGLSSYITGFAMPTFMADYNDVVYKVNFGNAPFSISSGNADANGYGNFEFSVPTNYYALCTKNLAEFG